MIAVSSTQESATSLMSAWYWAVMVIVGIVAVGLQLRRGMAWKRIAQHYPATFRFKPERRIFAARVVVGEGRYDKCLWLGISEQYVHVFGVGPSSLWLRAFSVPWSDISAEPEVFTYGPYSMDMIRLRFARVADVRVLVMEEDFRLLANASSGQLQQLDRSATHH